MQIDNKTTFDKASDTLFKFEMTNLPHLASLNQTRNLILNCSTVGIPGISIGVQKINWQGGFINTPASEITFDTVNMIFMIDENMENWKTLFNWLTFMHNNKDKYAVAWDEPVVTGILTYYNNWLNKKVFEMRFWKLWPTGVGSITLTQKTDGSQYLEAQVTFTFDRVELVD